MFNLSSHPLNRDKLHAEMAQNAAGAIVVFEGWVRNHNEGKKVSSLEYQVYPELALKEGEKILREAKEKFNLHEARAVHREGHLALGEIAIWIGATASHRDDAFKATRYVIDEIKYRLPVWKKEHYVDQKAVVGLLVSITTTMSTFQKVSTIKSRQSSRTRKSSKIVM